MPPGLSAELNPICEEYLSILDKYQQDVYNIRISHHLVWRVLRPQTTILHHRAGSRVERQLRMLPPDGKSDVDYKFEVTGVDVSNTESSEIYFKPRSECSDAKHAYGIVFVSPIMRDYLLTQEKYKSIFKHSLMPTSEQNFILLPNVFKENVVRECGLDMTRGSQNPSSPSISGYGAKNETDAVPCLRLTNWTSEAELWVSRTPSSDIFGKTWKHLIMDIVPLYIVPTGNRMSDKCEEEWRLSFVFVEKACFDRIDKCNPRIRRLFGLAKFVFKCFLDELDVLTSYHLKTLLFWKCETKPSVYWDNVQPLAFTQDLLKDLEDCLDNRSISHFFVHDCNIFPFGKMNVDIITKLKARFATMDQEMINVIKLTISFDLNVEGSADACVWIPEVKNELEHKTKEGVATGYISGYMTRLHSVIVHSLLENHKNGKLESCVRSLEAFMFGDIDRELCDVHVKELIPLIATQIHALSSDMKSQFCQFRSDMDHVEQNILEDDSDQILNIKIVHAFESYIRRDFAAVKAILDMVSLLRRRDRSIGVILSKLHMAYFLDPVLIFVMSHVKESGSSTNRVYVEPNVMLTHLKIQLQIQEQESLQTIPSGLDNLLTELHSLVSSSSKQEPYIGSLSYRHIGTLILMGYVEFLAKEGPQERWSPFPEFPSEKSILDISKIRNFDLR